MATSLSPSKSQREQYRRHPIVKQTLAFHEQPQAAGDTVVLEHRDHRNWIGCGYQRTEEQGG